MISHYRLLVLIIFVSVSAVRSARFSLGSGTGEQFTPFASANFTTYLAASINEDNIHLVSPNDTSGVVVYTQPVQVKLGFKTFFNWTTSNCPTSINPLLDVKYTDGVTFFVSETNPSINQINSSTTFMGISMLSNTLSIGYVTSLNEFHVCDWITAPDSTAIPFFRRTCKTFDYLKPRINCGAHLFIIRYDSETNEILMSLDYNDVLVYQMGRSFKQAPHFIGLAAGSDNFPRQQDIPFWIWESRDIVTEFTQETQRIYYTNFAGPDDDQNIMMTYYSPGSGLAVLKDSMALVQQQFSTKFMWTTLWCDPVYGGGDGFAFVLAKAVPETFAQNNGGSGSDLGVKLKSNVAIVGYSYVRNEFYVGKWTTPVADDISAVVPTFPSPIERLSCDQSHAFEISYYHGVIKLQVNGVFLFAAELALEPQAPYTIGFTGTNGQSSFTQVFSKWSFKSMPDLEEQWSITDFYQQRNSFSILGTAYVSNSTALGYLNTLTGLVNNTDNVGGFIYNTPFPAHNGFVSTFSWYSPYRAFCNVMSIFDGFTIVLTSDPLVLQMQNVSYNDLGIRNLRNVVSITVQELNDKATVCQWIEHQNTAATDFRMAEEYCRNFPLPRSACAISPYTVYIPFEINLTDQQLSLIAQDTGTVEFSVPLTLPPSSYYIGILAANHHQGKRNLKAWNLKLPPTANHFSFSLSNHTGYFETYNTNPLENNNQVVIDVGTNGLVVHKVPVPAHFGFTTSFAWSPANCYDTAGFSFFLTKTKPSDVTVKSDDETGRIATAGLSSLTSISFSTASKQFKAYFGSTFGDAAIFSSAKLNSTDFCQTRNYVIEYTTANIIHVFVDDELLMSIENRTRTAIDPSVYYVGIGGIGGTFTGWNFTTVAPIKQHFDFGFNNRSEIDTLGTASIVDNKLRLTTGGSESGVGLYPSMIYVHTGFNSTLTWTPSNCDAANNGADGFTLFLTKTHPLHSEVYSSSGGLLGVRAMSNVVMFAYSATYNEFYVCNWTTPLQYNFRYICNYVLPVPGPKMTCPNSYIFSYSYDHETFTLSVNGTQQFTASLMLEPVPYFVGLSGATGGGYFTQDVSDWSFESIAL